MHGPLQKKQHQMFSSDSHVIDMLCIAVMKNVMHKKQYA